MNNLEGIILKNFGSKPSTEPFDIWHNAEKAMKEYAEFYCEKFRTDLLNSCFDRDGIQLLDEIDIIQTKLPEHD